MNIKTEWLDWLEASAGWLHQRYRQAWARRLPKRSEPAPPAGPLSRPGKPWGAIVAHVERDPREVVVHLDLPAPHTVEADVRIIDSTLAISVLRSGSGIEQARLEDCYRRAIPLPSEVDPGSTVHKVHGDELVIRMQPKSTRRPSSRTGAKRRTRAAGVADVSVGAPAETKESAAQPKTATPKKGNRRSRTTGQVSKLPVGVVRQDPSAR